MDPSVPFAVDRTSRVPLTDQLVTAVKRSVREARYGVGDVLPGLRAIAASAQVSEKVVRQALRRLADDGWLRLRRGVGSEVLDPTQGRGVGRVLFLSSDFGIGYYTSLLKSSIRQTIERAGYLFEEAMAFDGRNRPREGAISKLLAERWDVVIEHVPKPLPHRLLIASEIPFLTLGTDRRLDLPMAPKCIGCGTVDIAAGLGDFIRDVARKRVKSVLQIMYGNGPYDITELLRSFGVDVETMSVPLCRWHDETQRRSYRQMTQWLAKWPLPELIFVSDDAVAQAALMALQEKGVRLPEDVFFACLVNRGIGVIWPRPLTRLEMDPVGFGEKVGHLVVGYLRTGETSNLRLGSTYVRGETF